MDDMDVEMYDAVQSADEDRAELKQWLAMKQRSIALASWLRCTDFIPDDFRSAIQLLVKFDPAGTSLPKWLERSLATVKSTTQAVDAYINSPLDDETLAEEAIMRTWHGGHSRVSSSQSSKSLNKFSSQKKAQRLHEAFSVQYHGAAHIRFCETLRDGYDQWYQPSVHYGRIIPMLQSSCTGKSRMQYQIAAECIPTFTLCFRHYDAAKAIDPSQGWPYGDRDAVSFFQADEQASSELMAAAFLGQLYQGLADHVHGTDVHCFGHLAPSLDMTDREVFLSNVCTAARSAISQQSQSSASCAEASNTEVRCKMLYRQFVDAHANALGNALNARSRYLPVEFLLVIDEFAELRKTGTQPLQPGNTDSLSFLTAIRRIFKAGDNEGAASTFWLVLLDTHGETYTLYPVSKERASSARLSDGSRDPLPPWIDLGFDVNVLSPPLSPNEALDLDWLKKWGRPYWDTLVTSDLLPEAAIKLFCGAIEATEENHVIAAMSRRIYLPLSHDSSNTPLQLAAVERHMRYMHSIGWEDGVVSTAAPSEPLLSLAAVHSTLENPEAYRTVVMQFIDRILVNEHIIERGWLGETMAALILIIARDAATCIVSKNSTINPDHSVDISWRHTFFTQNPAKPAVNPVTVTSFFKTLFGDDTILPKSFAKSFADNALLSFTHFDLLPEILVGEIPVSLLRHGWCRGVAFHCAANQPIYDLIIPVYCGDRSTAFDDHKFSYIAVQIKAKMAAASKTLLEGLTGPRVTLGNLGQHKPDHVVLLIDLGTNARFLGGRKLVHSGHQAAIPSKSAGVALNYITPEPDRWFFHARGATEDTYPFLDNFGAGLLYKVLNLKRVVDDARDGREVVRTAATGWNEKTRTILNNSNFV
ncbi:hypothetical protein C8R45DRAFT_336049 [Mycena sanguinolenta]|nr:hypothetical protein C8R45DRAFT_336049 [Mycena sanguinolenta]